MPKGGVSAKVTNSLQIDARWHLCNFNHLTFWFFPVFSSIFIWTHSLKAKGGSEFQKIRWDFHRLTARRTTPTRTMRSLFWPWGCIRSICCRRRRPVWFATKSSALVTTFFRKRTWPLIYKNYGIKFPSSPSVLYSIPLQRIRVTFGMWHQTEGGG